MKLFRKIGLVFLCQWVLMAAVHAQDKPSFDVYPRAGVGLNWLNFVRLDGTDLNTYFTTLNLGLAANYGRYYFDLGGELFGVDSNKEGADIGNVERQDFTFTSGYFLNEKTSVFVGYTFGETKDDLRGDFHEDVGFFVGAGYGFSRKDTIYSTTLAYANLDGSIDVDGDAAASTTGDTNGFSFGFSMSGPFRKTMGYSIGIKIRQYTYEVNDSNLSSDKAVTSLNLGLIF